MPTIHSLVSRVGLIAVATTTALPAQVADEPEKVADLVAETTVEDPIGIIPLEPSDTAFGSAMRVIETPRSISSVTAEMIDLYDIDDINDLVSLTSGTYTSSFFGVPGALDIRGAPGETFFRGMKRIKNPGNFPTPIGASLRIDVVKGPPSPIYGPGPIGGYLNFIPKSARASTGRYLNKPTGAITTTLGAWDKRVLTAEVGGPAPVFGKDGGYYAYVLAENSGSFYDNTFQDQLIVQASFDYDLTDSIRVEFGGQYQYYGGTENAGWNRLSQELIDDHIYLTGSPPNVDTDGDGRMSRAELLAANLTPSAFRPYGNTNPAAPNPNYALLNPGTASLERNQVLIAPEDDVDSKSTVLFFDVIKTFGPHSTLTNKFFVDTLDRYKFAAYGFSQKQEATTVENKLVFDFRLAPNDSLTINNTIAGSVYWNKANGRSDTSSEIFDRRDLTQPSSAVDKMHHSVLRPDLKPWDNDVTSEYTNLSVGIISDIVMRQRTHLIFGGRLDRIPKITSKNNGLNTPVVRPAPLPGRPAFARGEVVESDDSGTSWNISLTHQLFRDAGALDEMTVYVTRAHQALLSSGQAGEVSPGPVLSGPFDGTELREAGIKTSWFKGKMFAAAGFYSQTRSGVSDAAVDLTVTATKGEGAEFEVRWVPVKEFSLAAAANWQKTVYDPPTLLQPSGAIGVNAGFQFGNPAMTGVPGENAYGGTIGTSVPAALNATEFNERAGLPDKVISLTGSYSFSKFTATLGATYQASVAADHFKTIILPSATVLNGSLGYKASENWSMKLSVTNITDEWYFRANFPDLFGGVVVLPMPERGWELSATFQF